MVVAKLSALVRAALAAAAASSPRSAVAVACRGGVGLATLGVGGEGRMVEPHDDGLAAAVEVEVADSVPDRAVQGPAAAENPLEVTEAVDGDRYRQSALGRLDRRRQRSRSRRR